MGVDFTNVNIDTTDIFIFAGIVLAAIGGIWGIRKMISLANISADYEFDEGRPPDGWYDENDVLHTYEGREDEYDESFVRISKDD